MGQTHQQELVARPKVAKGGKDPRRHAEQPHLSDPKSSRSQEHTLPPEDTKDQQAEAVVGSTEAVHDSTHPRDHSSAALQAPHAKSENPARHLLAGSQARQRFRGEQSIDLHMHRTLRPGAVVRRAAGLVERGAAYAEEKKSASEKMNKSVSIK